jgi:hypothetical protein
MADLHSQVSDTLKRMDGEDVRDVDLRKELEDRIVFLNNTPELLHDLFVAAIEAMSLGRKTNLLTSQQFILGQNDTMAIRVNLWPALENKSSHSEANIKLYSYEDAHDHNFDFVTIGHFGPGYFTRIYEYDRDKYAGIAGEDVDLTHIADLNLRVGDMLWFQSGRHVHTQGLPATFSATINYILKDPVENSKPQFYFDIERSKILSLTDNTTSKQMNLLDMCATFPGVNGREIIEFYATKSTSPLLKRKAEELRSTKSVPAE